MVDPKSPSLSFLGNLLHTRTATVLCAGFFAAQTFLVATGLPAIPCWFHAWTGLPCPLCGISHSIGALVRGHIRNGLALHPFGLAALLLGILICTAALLPEDHRLALASGFEKIEQRTGISAILVIMLFAFWFVRMTLDGLWYATPTVGH